MNNNEYKYVIINRNFVCTQYYVLVISFTLNNRSQRDMITPYGKLFVMFFTKHSLHERFFKKWTSFRCWRFRHIVITSRQRRSRCSKLIVNEFTINFFRYTSIVCRFTRKFRNIIMSVFSCVIIILYYLHNYRAINVVSESSKKIKKSPCSSFYYRKHNNELSVSNKNNNDCIMYYKRPVKVFNRFVRYNYFAIVPRVVFTRRKY